MYLLYYNPSKKNIETDNDTGPYILLVGGAFNTPPAWFRWGRFASYFFYGLNAFIHLEFKDAAPIK